MMGALPTDGDAERAVGANGMCPHNFGRVHGPVRPSVRSSLPMATGSQTSARCLPGVIGQGATNVPRRALPNLFFLRLLVELVGRLALLRCGALAGRSLQSGAASGLRTESLVVARLGSFDRRVWCASGARL